MTDIALELIEKELKQVKAERRKEELKFRCLAREQHRVSSEYVKHRQAEAELEKSRQKLCDSPL